MNGERDKLVNLRIQGECVLGIYKGFTLFELLVTLLIFTIVIMFAYPSYINVMKSIESKRVRTTLLNANNEAKLHAYLMKRDVLLCLTDENDICNRQADKKVLLFIDNNDNNNFDGQDVLVQQYPLNIKYGVLEMRMSALRPYMKYYGDTGMPRGHFGHFNYCIYGDNVRSHRVVVSNVGYLRVDEGC